MLPKITDVNINYVKRGNENIGIIFPGGSGGNFLYTFYTSHPDLTFASIDRNENKSRGSFHTQHRSLFGEVPGVTSSDLEGSNFKKDFIGHFYNQQLVRTTYPSHYLISIAPDPDMYLFLIYMLIQKTFRWRDDFKILNLDEKINHIAGMLFFIKKYNYTAEFCDMLYTTKDLFYNKTANQRVMEYRRFNKIHHSIYIDYFENMLSQTNYTNNHIQNLKLQIKKEKEFLQLNKNKLFI